MPLAFESNSYISEFDSVQILLFCRLLSENVKILITLHQKIIILPVALYGFVTCSLTLSEEHGEVVWEQRAEKNIWTEEV
jgi:hypothetical protein